MLVNLDAEEEEYKHKYLYREKLVGEKLEVTLRR